MKKLLGVQYRPKTECYHPYKLETKSTMWHEYYWCFLCGKLTRDFKKSNSKKKFVR